MAKHPGDDGDWYPGSAFPKPMSIRDRINTQLGVTSEAVIREMEKEEAFLASVKPFTEKRFTDRRPIPGRDRLIP